LLWIGALRLIAASAEALDIKEKGGDEAAEMGRNKRRRTSSEEGGGTKIARDNKEKILQYKLLPLPDGLRASVENSHYISTARWSMLLEATASNSLLALASGSPIRSSSSASDVCMHDQVRLLWALIKQQHHIFTAANPQSRDHCHCLMGFGFQLLELGLPHLKMTLTSAACQ